MEVSDPWFTFIQSGIKTIEGRKNSPTWEWIKPGSIFLMSCEDRSFQVKCTKITLWPSVRSYLEGEGLKSTLPGIETIEEGERIYFQWSTKEEVNKYGFKAIHVELYY